MRFSLKKQNTKKALHETDLKTNTKNRKLTPSVLLWYDGKTKRGGQVCTFALSYFLHASQIQHTVTIEVRSLDDALRLKNAHTPS